MIKRKRIWQPICVALMACAMAFACAPKSFAVSTVLYTVEDLATDADLTPANIDTLKSSGFRTLVLFAMGIDASGNFSYSGQNICVNGSYVGPSTWGSKLSQCLGGSGGMNRIEVSIGGWGSPTFTNIKNLIASQGTGSGTNLYRNLAALKAALPITAINYDDEVTYDSASSVNFGKMAGAVGMKITLCPYTQSGYWNAVGAGLTNCDYCYVQCYDGGAGNDPGNWAGLINGSVNGSHGITVLPLYWDNDRNDSIYTGKMAAWGREGCVGGGMYPVCYGCNKSGLMSVLAHYNDMIRANTDSLPYFMIVNKYNGLAMDLISGNLSNGATINQWSYDYNGPNQRWAILPTEGNAHFKLISFVSGKCACIDGDSTTPGAALHAWDYVGANPGQQFDLVDAGNGWFKIRNVKSGLVLDDSGWGTTNNTPIVQWNDGGSQDNQLWRLQPWGDYFFRADSGRYVCVQGAGSTNGSRIIQYDWQNNPWFKWRFTNEGNGWYGLFSLNALTRALCVEGSSTVPGHWTHLWDYNTSNVGDQKIRIMPQLNGKFKFYFAHDGQTWDIPGGQTGNNVELEQYTDNGNSWQKFGMERVP